MEPNKDKDQDEHSRPGIARPGNQPDQRQLPNAPPQPDTRQPSSSSGMVPIGTGNPDLDPACMGPSQRIDLRQRNPLVPQGMMFDPSQLHPSHARSDSRPDPQNLPPGARFDPFGPPDPGEIIPGRHGIIPSSRFGETDPDHFQPPGIPQDPMGKSVKSPFSRPPNRPPGGGPPGSGPFGGFGGPFV